MTGANVSYPPTPAISVVSAFDPTLPLGTLANQLHWRLRSGSPDFVLKARISAVAMQIRKPIMMAIVASD